MRLLLDTHALVWFIRGSGDLSSPARGAILNEQSTVYVSVASAWEIAIKVGLGKWPEAEMFLSNFERNVADEGFALLRIMVPHVRLAGLMPGVHRDPFDRLLVAQARTEDLTLVSSDQKLRQLGASCLW